MNFQCSTFSIGDPIPITGILIIRHGPKVTRKHPLESTPLSKDGIMEVKNFANHWKGPIPNRVTSSPIDRCMDTASIINTDLDWNMQIEQNKLLGSHGAYIHNARAVGNQLSELNEYDTMQFFREHINGEEKEGMYSIEEGSKRLLTDLEKFCDFGLTLAVSHDVIISALGHYLGISCMKWPEPLEGLMIQKL